MASPEDLRQLVVSVVQDELGPQLRVLESHVAERIYEGLTRGQGHNGTSPAAMALLRDSLGSIQQAFTQADILNGLLDSAAGFAGRAAIFVLRSGSWTGWRARGFPSPDLKEVTLNSSCPLVRRVLDERVPGSAVQSDFDVELLGALGPPAEGAKVLLFPLLIREKVVALIYADSGTGSGDLVHGAPLECLVRFAGVWVEAASARKAGASASAEAESKPVQLPVPEMTVEFPRPGSDASFEPQGEMTAVPVESPAEGAVSGITKGAGGPEPSGTMDEHDLHQKARRFARLLVDEIRLYNERKVEEGRNHGDLYTRLRTEIAKSRAAYDKRYGNSPAASADYFREELVRILANNNSSLLGTEDSG